MRFYKKVLNAIKAICGERTIEKIKKYTFIKYYHMLYILGFGWLFNHDYESDKDYGHSAMIIDIKIDGDDAITVTEKNKSVGKIHHLLLNIVYNIMISLIILWPICFNVYRVIYTKNVKRITEILFQMIFVVQYIFGSIYFSNKHFYEKLRYRDELTIIYTFSLLLSFFLSCIIAIGAVLLLVFGQHITVYSDIYIEPFVYVKVILAILLFFEKWLTYFVFFSNMITFSIVMLSHRAKIKKYSHKIKVQKSSDFSNIVSNVTAEFNTMKYEYGKTISKLNNIFSITNILGLAAIYYIVKDIVAYTFYPVDILNLTLFILVDVVYIFCINQVKTSIDKIKKEMTNSKYLSDIMSRASRPVGKRTDNSTAENLSELYDTTFHTMVSSEKSSEILEYIIMKDTLNSQWESFKFLGFEISDSNIVQKIIGIILALVVSKNISDGVSI